LILLDLKGHPHPPRLFLLASNWTWRRIAGNPSKSEVARILLLNPYYLNYYKMSRARSIREPAGLLYLRQAAWFGTSAEAAKRNLGERKLKSVSAMREVAQAYLETLWELVDNHSPAEEALRLRDEVTSDPKLSETERASLLAMLSVLIDKGNLEGAA
jgi:hypothetical protein